MLAVAVFCLDNMFTGIWRRLRRLRITFFPFTRTHVRAYSLPCLRHWIIDILDFIKNAIKNAASRRPSGSIHSSRARDSLGWPKTASQADMLGADGLVVQYRNRYDTLIKNCRPSLMNDLRVRSKPSGVWARVGSRFCRLLL